MRQHLPIFAVLALGACGPGPISTPSTQAEAATPTVGDRMVVRTGEVEFRVDDLDATHALLLRTTAEHGGSVNGDTQDTVAGALRLRLRVRVPAVRFDAFVVAIDGIGELQHRTLDAADVTEPWLDLEARLAAKAALETRYLQLVERAANIGEVLSVEAELGKVRSDIESMQAKMRGLSDQVAMSSLTITCLQRAPTAVAAGADVDFAGAIRTGWNGLLRVVAGLLAIWPLLAGIAVATVVMIVLRRRSPSAPTVTITN